IESRPCYAETDNPFVDHRWAPLRALVTERWKFIETTRQELFDLAGDPHETHNLAKTQPAALLEMESLLHQLQAKMVPRQASSVNLSAKDQRILESLGYAAGGSAPAPPDRKEHLPDVKDMLPHYNKLSEAQRLYDQGAVTES